MRQAGDTAHRVKDSLLFLACHSYLGNKLPLVLVEELEVEEILGAQRLLTDDSLHRSNVLSNGIICVQLVRHLRVVPGRRENN